MRRLSNLWIGCLNLATLLCSIPIIGAALWLAQRPAACGSAVVSPLLGVGLAVLVVSLAGFVGACFDVACVLWAYLAALLLLIGALLLALIFGLTVTGGGGGGQPVLGRNYCEYHLDNYSPWMRRRIQQEPYWRAARACVVGSTACADVASWTPLDYLHRHLTPIQSGCCKPPTSCRYGEGMVAAEQEEDCYKWSNAAGVLCYGCDSCKAAVLERARAVWHRISLLSVFVVVFLIAVYALGCCAFRNARAYHPSYAFSKNALSRWNDEYRWGKWWRDRWDQLW